MPYERSMGYPSQMEPEKLFSTVEAAVEYDAECVAGFLADVHKTAIEYVLAKAMGESLQHNWARAVVVAADLIRRKLDMPEASNG